MSTTPSDNASGSSNPKVIPSLTRRAQDVTRGGTQKLKFVPVNPLRRQKEEVKNEPPPERLPPAASSSDRGRGRGRGDGSSRGRGRGAPRPPVEMTASGPFALGPAMVGNNARRPIPKSNFTPIPTPSNETRLGAGLSNTPAPSVKKEDKGKAKVMDDEETYSDQEDGVEIIDIEKIGDMDWMAPESLKKERQPVKIKKEDSGGTSGGDINLSNAVDLSESEDEEELEDIIDDFNQNVELETDPSLRQDKLYCFQFPSPFPTFKAANTAPAVSSSTKRVTFAEETKPESSQAATSAQTSDKDSTQPELVDGLIGKLEVYRSGLVKMRLTNGIVLDVTAATQPSFLQHAVEVNVEEKKMAVLGEVNKRFTVAPDVDTLLTAMQASDVAPMLLDGEENLIKMDDP
ncbi:hypothetical protein D9758_007173 [Tetrapyrgos nigripes]|uniref:DNA-directed RNA polymerase III subunit RPC4 n=1 Tax=Tetrapyrgos nigripes TaxID=182062 RepID=A0A8H5D3J4_9AGAR|nr:hypothetical protein D9758_007173 [Tetrapyrgos nigripes]